MGRWGVSFDEEGAKLTLKWGCADCVLSYQCPSLSQLTWLQWGARLICLPDAPLPREDTGPRLWGWLSGTVGSRQSDCPSSEHLGAAGLPLLACGGQSCPGMTQGARGTCPSWRCSHGCLESMIWASGPIKDVHRSIRLPMWGRMLPAKQSRYFATRRRLQVLDRKNCKY